MLIADHRFRENTSIHDTQTDRTRTLIASVRRSDMDWRQSRHLDNQCPLSGAFPVRTSRVACSVLRLNRLSSSSRARRSAEHQLPVAHRVRERWAALAGESTRSGFEGFGDQRPRVSVVGQFGFDFPGDKGAVFNAKCTQGRAQSRTRAAHSPQFSNTVVQPFDLGVPCAAQRRF